VRRTVEMKSGDVNGGWRIKDSYHPYSSSSKQVVATCMSETNKSETDHVDLCVKTESQRIKLARSINQIKPK
jgi:hypothetical protein